MNDKNMIKLDEKTGETIINLCTSCDCDLRDMAALLWGLIMQIYTHKKSLLYTREIGGQTGETVEFATGSKDNARTMLCKLHEQAVLTPLPEGKSFCDEAYLGAEDEYSDVSLAHFGLEGKKLYLELGQTDEDELHGISELFVTLCREIADDPDKSINRIKRVSREEEKKLLVLSKGEEMPYDKNMIWLDLFKQRTEIAPDSPAIIAPNGKLSYRELDNLSDRLASYIISKGITQGGFVAIMTDRIKEYVVAVIGIHKAGCAYVPIDISYKEKRIEYMLKDSQTALVLDEKTIELALNASLTDLPKVSPDNPAYMIYTSGSTGDPKGAVIPHRALMNYTLAVIKQNGLTEKDRVGAHKSFSFDAHIEDYFPPLSAGAAIYIMPECIRRDPGEIADFLNNNKITGCGFTTSVGKLLITGHKLNVRYITCGGEALTGVTSSNITIINEYGPTEFTNDATGYKLEKGRAYNVVPIGRPLPNCYAFVVDPFFNLLPEGVPGELCMAGIQTGLGYHNKPVKTKEAFMDCPFIDGISMYRTGDIVKYLPDGNLSFIGRMDDQVKLNGYRIEPGEIEALCGEYKGIEETVAMIMEVQGVKHLVLYYVAQKKEPVDREELKKHMESGFLPEYMYPEIYMELDKMPRLPNGKIDRRKLPEPDFVVETENVKPESALEIHMLNAARKLLPGIEFGITDDLFALGLSSIGAMRFIAMINELDYPTTYRVGDIMRYRSIRALIEGNRRVCYRYNTYYDKEKPTLVFIYGVAPISGTLQMLDLWTSVFNIYVIEPIDSHYNVLFDGPEYTEIEDMYLTILDNQVEGGLLNIAGLMGFSWGGFVSYTLAAAIEKKGGKPFVVLGDTDFNECMKEGEGGSGRFLPDLPDDFFDITGGAISKPEAITRLKLVFSINDTVTDIPFYDGQVVLLDAALIRNELAQFNHDRKIMALKDHARNLKIVSFPDHDHDGLFYDASLAGKYLEEFKMLLKRHMQCKL